MKKILCIVVALLVLVCAYALAEETAPCTHEVHKVDKVSNATCTKGADWKEYCAACGATLATWNDGATVAHTPVKVPGVAATCTEGGATDGSKCAVCNAVLEKVSATPALGHNWTVKVDGATCTEGGTLTEYCTRCNTVNMTRPEGAALGHDWNVKTQAATCTTPELLIEYCSRCPEINMEREVSGALGHNKGVVVPGYAATCTEDGLTDGAKCSRCGTTTLKQEVIPALGHDWVKRVVKPTESKRGYTEWSCTRCGEYTRSNYTDKLAAEAVAVDVALNPYGDIVTDLEDVVMPYTVEKDEELKHVCIIAKDIDVLRELHLSFALIEQLKAEGYMDICFIVDGYDLDITFEALEAEAVEAAKVDFPATGIIITLDPTATNEAGVAGCQVKVVLTNEPSVEAEGAEAEITDIVTGMTLTMGEAMIDVVGAGVYTF